MTETQITKWQDVPITNNFMFSKVLSDKQLCGEFLEVMLDIRIDHLEESNAEVTRRVDPYSKGVRFDVYVKDSGRIFDVEMQMKDTLELPKRARYYQSVCDTDSLDAGQFYSELKESYVIFLCPSDLFGKGLSRYTFENTCLEDRNVKLEDKTHKIFFNFNAYTRELNKNRRSVLQYLAEGKAQSTLAARLNKKLKEAKVNVKWRAEYMTLEMELIGREKVGRKIGLEEGIAIGTEQGEHAKAVAVAKNLIKMGLSVQQVSEATGLSVDEINNK